MPGAPGYTGGTFGNLPPPRGGVGPVLGYPGESGNPYYPVPGRGVTPLGWTLARTALFSIPFTMPGCRSGDDMRRERDYMRRMASDWYNSLTPEEQAALWQAYLLEWRRNREGDGGPPPEFGF